MRRRGFLRVLGATGAAAACSPKHAPEKLVPLLVPPENMIPGKVLEYRTVCRTCPAGCGVTARTREGRAIKLEGNPDDPISRGALCGRGQAAVQELYSNDRLLSPRLHGEAVSWDQALEALAKALPKGARVAMLTRPEPGATGEVQRAFMTAVGGKRAVVGDLPALRRASQKLFGRAEVPLFDLSAARSIVSFGADFVETWQSPVEHARGLAQGRGRSGEARTRFTWVSPRLSTTGLSSDKWIKVRPGGERAAALELLRGLDGGKSALADELRKRSPSAVLGSLDDELAEVTLLCNHKLGNIGKTVLYGVGPSDDGDALPPPDALDVLFLHRAELPAGYEKVPLIVSFGERADARVHLALPDRHALEAWDLLKPRATVLASQQPVIAPLGDTRQAGQVLGDLAAKLSLAGVPADFRDYAGKNATDALRSTGVARVDVAPASVTLLPSVALSPGAGSREPGADLVVFGFPTALPVADPASPSWLREVPDLLSGLSWSSWVELSPKTAAQAGAKEGEQVAVTTAGGEAALTLRINPALHDDAVAIPESAPELKTLRAGSAAKVRKSGPVSALVAAIAPMSRGQEGRELARAVSAASPRLPPPPKHREMIAEPEHPEHRWGMAIDLDRCTGCQACVVACYAENNIPVNGAVFANAGRSMAWLRIQRTYEKNQDGSLKLRVLPSLCQQCDAAPCEPVCPVYATYHTQEGLNAQVYNRCIGTRYCANNCPYDARVFNWKSPVFEGTLAMQLNPDVSVRDKGVMEKCTFCVQRIRTASFAAEQEGRRMYDGDVTPACAQTCPTQAIVFGDLRDPNSRASVLSSGPRRYTLLDDLNTRPAITYLARIEDET
jgi:Fe-S-cluster-containing dehydrogenase component